MSEPASDRKTTPRPEDQDERVAPHKYGGDEAAPVHPEHGEGVSHEAQHRRDGQSPRPAADDEEPRARPDVPPRSRPAPNRPRDTDLKHD
ncbi:MAG: hypothetical protein AB7O67_18420 [Vicinamibacterales bacterium]